jgi:hypothetical protein
MKRIITSKIQRGSLIHFALEDLTRESFEIIRKELKGVLEDRQGIYGLYRRGKVVKVGLGTNIFYRLRGHASSKRINWDTVSLYIIDKNYIRFLRDLETAVNRIAKPKYSFQRGRVKDEHYLERILKKRVNEKRKYLRQEKRNKDIELRDLKKDIEQMEKVIR